MICLLGVGRGLTCSVAYGLGDGGERAEMAVLVGLEGEVGVDGSSGMDRDVIVGRGLSSARTTSAGVPLLEFRFKRGVSRTCKFS